MGSSGINDSDYYDSMKLKHRTIRVADVLIDESTNKAYGLRLQILNEIRLEKYLNSENYTLQITEKLFALHDSWKEFIPTEKKDELETQIKEIKQKNKAKGIDTESHLVH